VLLWVVGASNGQSQSRSSISPPAADSQTALDRYVAAPDSTYRFRLVGTRPAPGYTTYLIELVSQTWRAPSEVDRTVWTHWLTVIKPDTVKHRQGFLYITGWDNGGPPPKAPDSSLVRMATQTSSVVAEVQMVPNQPLAFSDDHRPRYEDEIIVYTWDKFLKGGDERWPLRLPMTKAAVRAMDAVQAFCGDPGGCNAPLDGFVVAGGSKRGWTTWTTAAVDRRVVAIAPIVIDVLNIVPSFKHHLAVYGYYVPAVGDYEEMGLLGQVDSPRYRELMAIEEPYQYRYRLSLPKFIVNATGDQFFVPDSWRFYYQDLPGEKRLRYIPNAEHSLRGTDVWSSLTAWYLGILTKAAIPSYDWSVGSDGTIRVTTKTQPSEVKLWQASNPGARDFRLPSIGPRWTATTLAPRRDGSFVAKVAPPKIGWTAYMVELTFHSPLDSAPYKFTTGVKVIPDIEPARALLRRSPD
jgi:PhoPQ-activated pathogenicity-related protein